MSRAQDVDAQPSLSQMPPELSVEGAHSESGALVKGDGTAVTASRCGATATTGSPCSVQITEHLPNCTAILL